MVYPRPPIKEAACEVVFRENQPWDITLPAIIYSKLRESYPSRPSMGTSSFFRSRQDSVPQVVLSTVDARKQVKFGANSLVVSVLAPYNGWEEFSPRIKQALSTFIKVTRPPASHRYGFDIKMKSVFPVSHIRLVSTLRY